MIFKDEEVIAVHGDDGEVFHIDHKPEKLELTQDNIITEKEIENSFQFYFCDECKKQVSID